MRGAIRKSARAALIRARKLHALPLTTVTMVNSESRAFKIFRHDRAGDMGREGYHETGNPKRLIKRERRGSSSKNESARRSVRPSSIRTDPHRSAPIRNASVGGPFKFAKIGSRPPATARKRLRATKRPPTCDVGESDRSARGLLPSRSHVTFQSIVAEPAIYQAADSSE